MFGPLAERYPVMEEAPLMSRAEAIAAFWREWPELRVGLADEMAEGRYGEATAELSELVDAIDPALEWDLVPSRSGAYALCLSSAADPGLRSLTERWYLDSPPADGIWEYHSARIAVEPARVVVGDIGIHPFDVTVVAEPDPVTEELNITVGHPDLRRMDEALQLQVAFRLLDDLLGEDGLEFWVGSVDVVPHPLPWGMPFLDLAPEVDRLAAAATGQQWKMMPKDDPELGESQLFMNRALKRLHFLDMVEIVMVSIETSGPDDPVVRKVERDLAATLRTGGVIFAHRIFETFTTLYAYADPEAAEDAEGLAHRWRPVYEVFIHSDPGWDTYEDLRQ